MKVSSISKRLKHLMSEYGFRQVDILKKTEPYCITYGVKLNKSDLSQYVSGKTEPNQNKFFILSEALNISPSWLMGYDVPMRKKTDVNNSVEKDSDYSIVTTIATNFDVYPLTEDEQQEVLDFIKYIINKRKN